MSIYCRMTNCNAQHVVLTYCCHEKRLVIDSSKGLGYYGFIRSSLFCNKKYHGGCYEKHSTFQIAQQGSNVVWCIKSDMPFSYAVKKKQNKTRTHMGKRTGWFMYNKQSELGSLEINTVL